MNRGLRSAGDYNGAPAVHRRAPLQSAVGAAHSSAEHIGQHRPHGQPQPHDLGPLPCLGHHR